MLDWKPLHLYFDKSDNPSMARLVEALSQAYEFSYVEAAASCHQLILYLEGLRGMVVIQAHDCQHYQATLWRDQHIELESHPLPLEQILPCMMDYLWRMVVVPI
jgi:hypothetical protein